MRANKLKFLSIAICCFVSALYTEIKGSGDINRFEEAKRHYTSLNPNPRNQKIAREIMKNIADDDTNTNQFNALRILLESTILKDSLFSKNYLFDIILRSDAYSEVKITNAAKILLEFNCNANHDLLISAKRVGARKLITSPQYQYKAANVLYSSPNQADKNIALEAYRLVAINQNQTENIENRFGAAKELYPLTSRLYLNREIPNNDKEAALIVYRDIVNQQTADQPDQETIKRLYEVSEFLLGEQQYRQIALTTLVRIAGMHNYSNESYNSAKKLASQNFAEHQQVILTSYKNYFDNHNQLIMYEYTKEPLGLLLASTDNSHKETALRVYWKTLKNIIDTSCQPGKKIHVEFGICEIHEKLINQGHIITIPERLDIAALNNLNWLMRYLKSERVPSNQYKFTKPELSNFYQGYAKVFSANLKSGDPLFTTSYNDTLTCYRDLMVER